MWLILFTVLLCVPGCGMLLKIFFRCKNENRGNFSLHNSKPGISVAVDIILVNDTLLVDTVKISQPKTGSRAREQFINANTTSLSVISREVVPGEIAPIVELTRSKEQIRNVFLCSQNFLSMETIDYV